MKPGVPVVFEAEFEPEKGCIEGYWREWKVVANLEMVLKGNVQPISLGTQKKLTLKDKVEYIEGVSKDLAYGALALATAIIVIGLSPVILAGAGLLFAAGSAYAYTERK